MVLLNPPAVRNCEPPVGLSRIAGALRAAGEPVKLIDGARDALDWLSEQEGTDKEDRQARRVYRSRNHIRETLQSPRGYDSFDRYVKTVSDYTLLLNSPLPKEIRLTPADYRHSQLSPLRSEDIGRAQDNPESNPFYPWFSSVLKDLLGGEETRLGISLNYLSQVLTTAALIGFIQREFPATRILLGGGLISSWARRPGLEKLPFKADLIHPGRGEEAAVRFCDRKWAGEGTPWFGDLYDNPYMAPGPILPYSVADSCSWKRCSFCAERWENYPYREQEAPIAARQLAALTAEHSPALIHLSDSEISSAFMTELIKTPPGAPWYSFSRFTKEMTDLSYCRRLAQSGCRMLCLGLESGDQEVLNRLNKGIRLDWVSVILKNLKEAGIGTFVYLLFGTPAENRDAALRTRDFALEHRAYMNYLNLAVFTMPRISGEAESLEKTDFYEGDLSLATDFVHPGGWSRSEVRRFLDKEFRGVPELREILKRTPPVYTANHASFIKK
ncbi:MAG: radical SAM protein [Spirochaetales bacterium]|nr:radical SAM protein [Spirochaetales bacterium]